MRFIDTFSTMHIVLTRKNFTFQTKLLVISVHLFFYFILFCSQVQNSLHFSEQQMEL